MHVARGQDYAYYRSLLGPSIQHSKFNMYKYHIWYVRKCTTLYT